MRLPVFILLFCLSFVSGAPKRGSLKRRLSDESDHEAPLEPAAPIHDPIPKGGLRKIFLDDIVKEFAPNVGVPKGPLNEFLRKEWARGKLTTPQIQQFAMKAM